ncbi:fumarylacetoacetate hydrolase family protein [Paracoccus sp. TK19116]|uniref:Fumarylacetoacetate hydrolase family protein n=1 Tax=Paracoccus albicereus TaxID=2922394 RepID=A0ABT1MS19_9RHOB|nr:fumarylacetoacetate hydrolase family protein [Paracoccus albicereus]MCQ0971100.1 fumarylacetoacetate hydrolase family protein [Paracoccus albicereus]
MKLVCYRDGGQERLGVVEGDSVRRLSGHDGDLVSLIENYDALRSGLKADGEATPLDNVELLAPIPRPRRNIFCVGKNYSEHAREFAGSGYEAGATTDVDEFPAVFTKPASTVIASGQDVDLHADITDSVDYEVELTLIIGKGGKNIPAEKAHEHIWGYTIINDVTARDRQKQHKQWFLGKSLDSFCPMGPFAVTADEVTSEDLDLQTWVNGETRQKANTRDLIFDIPSLVATISAGLTLVPGDLIATGTPAGVGIGFNPPKFLKSGDVVEMEITGLGRLKNTFR